MASDIARMEAKDTFKRAILAGKIGKGDVLGIARIAGLVTALSPPSSTTRSARYSAGARGPAIRTPAGSAAEVAA